MYEIGINFKDSLALEIDAAQIKKDLSKYYENLTDEKFKEKIKDDVKNFKFMSKLCQKYGVDHSEIILMLFGAFPTMFDKRFITSLCRIYGRESKKINRNVGVKNESKSKSSTHSDKSEKHSQSIRGDANVVGDIIRKPYKVRRKGLQGSSN